MKVIARCASKVLTAAVGVAAGVPWVVLSGVGLACLWAADGVERVKDTVQDFLYVE